MESFSYKDGKLFCENVPVKSIADKVGTPVYVYSSESFERHFNQLNAVLDRENIRHLIAYAIKANSNLSVIKQFKKLGAGADVASGGEIYRAMKAGIEPSKMVYAGVGKTEDEINYALKIGIGQFNVESQSELERIDAAAYQCAVKAPIALRVNPNVNPKTHPYIATGMRKYKFGIPISQAYELYKQMKNMHNIEIKGMHCHIGSQMTECSALESVSDILTNFLMQLKSIGIKLETVDIGGGIGIRYMNNATIDLAVYAKIAKKIVSVYPDSLLICEPGRFLTGEGGILLTKLLYVKDNGEKLFYIVDAGMTDLIRPALYDAGHNIIPETKSVGKVTADIVGPVCESGDFLAKNMEIDHIDEGGLLAVMSAGAYGFSMASHYNARVNAAEVLVDKDSFSTIRKREIYYDLIKNEVELGD